MDDDHSCRQFVLSQMTIWHQVLRNSEKETVHCIPPREGRVFKWNQYWREWDPDWENGWERVHTVLAVTEQCVGPLDGSRGLSESYRWCWQKRFNSVQSLSRVRPFATPWTVARQDSLSITNSRSLLKLTSIESVMPSKHFILCCPLLLLPSVFPSIRVFSNESVLCIRWPKYWSFSFSISPSNEYSGKKD